MTEKPLRIGEVAERAETTVRTVRYYEEVGLLPGSEERSHGQHRSYSEADVERLREILQLKELLEPLARPAPGRSSRPRRPARSSASATAARPRPPSASACSTRPPATSTASSR